MVREVVAACTGCCQASPLDKSSRRMLPTSPRSSRAAEDAGAEALTVANTYQGMSVNTRTRKSRLLAGSQAVLSGPDNSADYAPARLRVKPCGKNTGCKASGN